MSMAHTADIVAEGEAAPAAAGRVSLAASGGSAQEVAGTMIATLHGLKLPGPDCDSYRAGVMRLARLFGRGLSAPEAPRQG